MEAGINLYDFNKVNMGKLPCKDKTLIFNKIRTYFLKFAEKYFMLLCHENRDYTIFNTNNKDVSDTMTEDIFECMRNRGYLFIDTEEVADGMALEIWVKKEGEEEATLFMLFPYSSAVIEY